MSASLAQGSVATRRINAPFWLALAAVIAAYVGAFYVLTALVPQPTVAGTLAALTLGGGAYLQRAIEKRLHTPSSPVETRAGYQRPWWMLLALGTAAIWLAQAALPFVQLRVGPDTAIFTSIDSTLRLLAPLVAAAVGVVVAQRSDQFPLVVTVAAVVIAWLLDGVTYSLVVGFATGTPPPPDFGTPPPGAPPLPGPSGLVGYLTTGQLPLLLTAALLGFWYGTRTRLQAYLGGLLREVTPENRQTIVDLAYEEARAAQAREAVTERDG